MLRLPKNTKKTAPRFRPPAKVDHGFSSKPAEPDPCSLLLATGYWRLWFSLAGVGMADGRKYGWLAHPQGALAHDW